MALDDAADYVDEELTVGVVGEEDAVGGAARDDVVAGVLEADAQRASDASTLRRELAANSGCDQVVAISAHVPWPVETRIWHCKT